MGKAAMVAAITASLAMAQRVRGAEEMLGGRATGQCSTHGFHVKYLKIAMVLKDCLLPGETWSSRCAI